MTEGLPHALASMEPVVKALVIAILAGLIACGDSSPRDAGTPADALVSDGAVFDGATRDAQVRMDAGVRDAHGEDAGELADAVALDAADGAMIDGGEMDDSGIDGGELDGGGAKDGAMDGGSDAAADSATVLDAQPDGSSEDSGELNDAGADGSMEVDAGPFNGQLLLNEIDYDQPATDMMEFIELFNPGPEPAPLAGVQLILVNDAGVHYDTIELSMAGPSLAVGAFLVVHALGVSVPSGPLTITFSRERDNVQNGPADGMLIYDSLRGRVLDTLGYEGTTSTVVGGMTVQLSSSLSDNAASGGLSRVPDGASLDPVFTECLTPGSANVDSAAMPCP